MDHVILSSLERSGLLKKVYTANSVSSTNSCVKQLAREGCTGPLLYVSEVQTAGRGRMGRSWNSPAESGIWMSLFFTPEKPPENLSALTLLAAVSVVRGIRKEYPSLQPLIKWPNDVLVPSYDGYKKCCGILTESITFGTDVSVIFGIGINCSPSAYPEELREKATSLSEACGCPVDREKLILALVPELLSLTDRFMKEGNLSFITEEYNSQLCHRNRTVYLVDADGSRQGPFTAKGIRPDGALLIQETDGSLRPLISGEISVRGEHGYV